MGNDIPIGEVLHLIEKEADREALRQGKKRQENVWERREPDYLPILISQTMPERSGLPSYDLKQQFFDPQKMLYEQLWLALGSLRTKTDAVPSVRVNFGVGFLASVFGLNQEVFPDKMPWLRRHLSMRKIAKMSLDDFEPVSEKGLLPAFRRYLNVYQNYLKDSPVRIYLPDTQGPFDSAHLVMGDSIFGEFHRNPQSILHLLSLTSHVYRESTFLLKSLIGEPLNEGYHSCNLRMSHCGVRCCEDSTTLLSPKLAELTIPDLRNAIGSFHSWIHFCGDGRHILKLFLSLREVEGINLGNPEKHDWETTMKEIIAARKVYYGEAYRREKRKR